MDELLYNLNIERSVLNSIIFEPSQIDEIKGFLFSEDFYIPAHQLIFTAMVELSEKELPIDEEFIRKQMRNDFNESVMVDVLLANPISNLTSYITQIKVYAQQRYLLSFANSMPKELSESENVDDLINDSIKKMEDIADLSINSHEAGTREFTERFADKFATAKDHGGFSGIKTGIKEVDSLIDGFAPGDLVIIAARPSMGKTALATSITTNVIKSGEDVLFDSMEMPGEDIMLRFIASRTNDSIKDLKSGVVKDVAVFNSALNYFKNSGLHLQDESYIPFARLKAKALRKLRKNKNISLWVIDHLRYIKKPGKDIAQETSEITKECKKIAKEFGITVCVLSQLNRVNESRANKRPMLSDLRDSGAVEEDADIILFPHRESYYERDDSAQVQAQGYEDAEIIIGKSRNGQTGTASTKFIGPTTTFKDSVPIVYEYGAVNNDSVSIPEIRA